MDDRPRFHFAADKWMNDVIPFFDGRQYHVFFDYNPRDVAWTAQSDWGHAVSGDMVHWTQAPSAFGPTPGGPDQGGCWTGCVVRNGDQFAALYTGITDFETMHQVQCLATSPDMRHWTKHPGNPVIPASLKPPGAGECFRDPCAWREGDAWYCVVGSEKGRQEGGLALLYRSGDLVDWQYVGVLSEGVRERTGFDYECPDFFPLGDKWVLLTSRDKTWWQVGRYENYHFTPEQWGPCDGDSRHFYAGKTLVDARGRRILFGWITETRSSEEQKLAGWAGALSLPRVVTLRADNTLGFEPADELLALRGAHRRMDPIDLREGASQESNRLLPDVRGECLEIVARFAPGFKASQLGLLVRATPDLAECTRLTYCRVAGSLMGAPLKLAPDEPLELRAYVDRSIVEVFANGRACATARTHPQAGDALGVGVFARGGWAMCQGVDVWEL